MTNEEIKLEEQLEGKPKFKEIYDKSSSKIKEIFRQVAIKSVPYCHEIFPTDTPDFRLNKNSINFCLMKLMQREKCLRIHLRTDKNVKLSSDVLQVKLLQKHNYNGIEWQEIKVFESNQVDEVVRIISEVYSNFDRVKHY